MGVTLDEPNVKQQQCCTASVEEVLMVITKIKLQTADEEELKIAS